MFTGIVETVAEILDIKKDGTNIHFTIKSRIARFLKVDQSVSHNGVCLTVVSKNNISFVVTAIKETLDITTLSFLKKGDKINLERAMQAGERLDGHMVQGHVDQTASVTKMKEVNGSWEFHFEFDEKPKFLLVDKGSVCIDGASLTVVKSKGKNFSVSIIPYTYEHTIFSSYKPGTHVNIEFDIIGKYVEKIIKQQKASL